MFWSVKKSTRAFTLIELLVVIAIIGILSSIVLASLNTARTKSRDVRRIADIKQIQLALALYYDSNSSYPRTDIYATANSLIPLYMSVVPKDPLSTTASPKYYLYAPLGSGTCGTGATSYHLGAILEDSTNQAFNTDNDDPGTDGTCSSVVSPPGVSNFNGNLSSNCASAAGGTDFCYDVKP